MTKQVIPELGLDSYSCPHCGALAHQFWQRVFIDAYEGNEKPAIYTPEGVNWDFITRMEDSDEKRLIEKFAERLTKNLLTFQPTNNDNI